MKAVYSSGILLTILLILSFRISGTHAMTIVRYELNIRLLCVILGHSACLYVED